MGYADTLEVSLDEGVHKSSKSISEHQEEPNYQDGGGVNSIELGVQEEVNPSSEVLPSCKTSLTPQTSLIVISTKSQLVKTPPSEYEAENRRVPFFRYFGPTAIVPGFKQVVVSVRELRRSTGAESGPASKSP